MNRRQLVRAAAGLVPLLGGASVSVRAEETTPRHRILLQVSVNDPALMDLALINIRNIAKYYEAKGERVAIDLTAFGPGYVMLRADTSPVKAKVTEIKRLYPFVRFSACQNARRAMAVAEGKNPEDVPQMSEAEDVPAGVVHISELQEHGWSYLRP